MRRAAIRWTGLGLLVLAGPGVAQGETLADQLIARRSEVEQLNSELELLREEQRSTLAGLAAQRAELSASVDRQALAAREAQRKLDEVEARLAEAGASGDGLRPRIDAAVDALSAYIAAGLPFKREERLAELAAFRQQVATGTLPPARAVNRLWAFFEDEFRLTRDISLQSQTIELGGERLLADVAKLGTMALYFRTQDGRVGLARRDGDAWQFEPAADAQAEQQIRALFDALGKQIRQGYFELPLAATGAGR